MGERVSQQRRSCIPTAVFLLLNQIGCEMESPNNYSRTSVFVRVVLPLFIVWIVSVFSASWFVFDLAPTLPMWFSAPACGFVCAALFIFTAFVAVVIGFFCPSKR